MQSTDELNASACFFFALVWKFCWYLLWFFMDVHPDMAYGASDPCGYVHSSLRKDAFFINDQSVICTTIIRELGECLKLFISNENGEEK